MRVLPLAFAVGATVLTVYAAVLVLFAVNEATRWADARGFDVTKIVHFLPFILVIIFVLPKFKQGITFLRGGFR